MEKYLVYKDLIIEYGDLSVEGRSSDLQREVSDFAGDKELEIELGSGCSGFSLSLARLYPEKRFMAFEFKEELLLKAVKIADEEGLSNIRFVRGRIEDIENLFSEPRVSKIYLNFSDPWPKNRHAKRRLTHKGFLDRYVNVLLPGGIFEFKTDHDGMYEFTLEEFVEAGFVVDEKTEDLHSHDRDIIMTEYEKKYLEQGKKIKYIKAIIEK